MTVLKNVGDAIEGERLVCEYRRPSKLRPKRVSAASGHRQWRITIKDAFCIIEKKYRWLGK